MPDNWNCEWCGSPISHAERLRFEVSQTDFEQGENWRSVLDPANSLAEPVVTCERCRNGILENRADLEREEDQHERLRGFRARVMGWGRWRWPRSFCSQSSTAAGCGVSPFHAGDPAGYGACAASFARAGAVVPGVPIRA
jgi:hypothetical protein